MQIKKGQNRIVFMFLKLGIVVKFPIIHFTHFVKNLLFETRSGLLLKYLKTSSDNYQSPRFLLFKGILDNRREFRFYWRTRHPFLQPTYFSFVGLFTIQKIGKPCGFSRTDLQHQLEELTDGKIWEDFHHFSDPKNFCFDGKLRILDYGDKRTQEVISECGVKIFNEFNPNYDWDVEKEKLNEKEKLKRLT